MKADRLYPAILKITGIIIISLSAPGLFPVPSGLPPEEVSPAAALWTVQPQSWKKSLSSPVPHPDDRKGVLNEALFRRAEGHLFHAGELTELLEEEEKKLMNRIRHILHSAWWQDIDRTDSVYRVRRSLRRSAHREIASAYYQSLQSLDRIEDSEFRAQESFTELHKTVLRNYIIYLFYLGELNMSVPYLDQYASYPETETEWPLHYYYTVAWTHILKSSADRTDLTDDFLRTLRKKRNYHLLRTVELQYGRDDLRYREAARLVYLDELGSPRASSVR